MIFGLLGFIEQGIMWRWYGCHFSTQKSLVNSYRGPTCALFQASFWCENCRCSKPLAVRSQDVVEDIQLNPKSVSFGCYDLLILLQFFNTSNIQPNTISHIQTKHPIPNTQTKKPKTQIETQGPKSQIPKHQSLQNFQPVHRLEAVVAQKEPVKLSQDGSGVRWLPIFWGSIHFRSTGFLRFKKGWYILLCWECVCMWYLCLNMKYIWYLGEIFVSRTYMRWINININIYIYVKTLQRSLLSPTW